MRTWPGGIALGGDYNPEQWPEDLWAHDVRLMKEAGVSFATVGVFAWSVLEPEPGRYELAWLDRALDLLHGAGVAVDLATGTASPPAWLSSRYPESLPVDRDGRTRWPGGRQAWCPSSTAFREHSLALVDRLATRYHDHPALAMWHVSNEYACHNAPCYCDACAAAFRRWLRARYDTVEAMDAAWGAAFWSQRHGGWDEVLPPRLAPTPSNPTQVLDYARFTSDTLLDAFRAERDLLHRLSPGVPVTTNFMTLDHFRHLDYHDWAPEQDVVSTDHYLDGSLDDPEAELAFAADLTRGLAGGGSWLLMEHSTSAVNWQQVNRAKAPGQVLRNSIGHVARGADGLGFFQWRASRAGSEKYHSAMLPHAGTDTRVWREVVELGDVCRRVAEVAGSRVRSEVAVLWDYEAGWACDQPFHPSSLVTYGATAHRLHAELRRRGITADVVHPTADLSTYRLVIVATLYLTTDETAEHLRRAAERGAQLLVTYFSGIVDADDHVRLGGYPGAFRELLGVRVDEFVPLAAGQAVHLDDGSSATTWTEDLRADDAQVLRHYTDGPLPGAPALTRRAAGDGAAWYLATEPDDGMLASLVAELVAAAGVTPTAQAPEGVEVVRRHGPEASYLFVLNHTTEPVTVAASGHDLVGDARVDGELNLPAGAVAVVREP
ncbi:MAG TPA: beta-galactosidase [Actinomycetales bacterium]|nr:beta-galactosidase [Actinomycetales bacterium]